MNNASCRRARAALFVSAATMSLVLGGTAQAHGLGASTDSEYPTGSIFEPQSIDALAPQGSFLEPQSTVAAPPETSILEPQVVISDPGTPDTALDPNDVTGIGQMVIDQQNGFIGLCTGTLINPRTVIFAAHCVNENPDETDFQDPWGYGAANGGIPIAFGFHSNNNAAGNSAFGNYLNNYQTDVANYLYNVNQVTYNPASTELGVGNNFLQGDVAIATLDTPAGNVPTWAILLSQLPAPDSIDPTTGTGYHVTIAGYGDNGVGSTGDSGNLDFRRRVAENYIGLLGSLDDQDSFIFGAPDGLPQNLFQLDFDDPARGTLNASIYDFNVFKDDALPNEGITAPGDSGGPLILDEAYSQKLVIAVLSGGDRFYAAQPSASYGTTSFYQPLYLFWDWIAANNNYHYVGAKAGDGNWTDPTHWISNIDPSYMSIVGGNLVNGVPQYLGDGINGTSGKFGEVCFESGADSDCYNVATGVETYNGTEYQYDPAGGEPGMTPLPDPTLDNGLPGATNFVPNDRDPDADTHTRGAYFDVTLAAAGKTTLDTDVTVDRLSVIGDQSKLDVTSTGSLTSLLDVTQTAGLVNVDGTVTTPGDYFLLSGGLSGTGRINTPYLTSITGMIAPGTVGTIGTLTVGGNLILSSGNVLLIDLGENGTGDLLAVKGDPDTGADGVAAIGGNVLFSPIAGYRPRFADEHTFLTADGGVDGAFTVGSSSISAILYPSLIYTDNSVSVKVLARDYADVVDNSSLVQRSFAQLLDQDRANYANLSTLYGELDLLSLAELEPTLESMAPRTEKTRTSLGILATESLSKLYRDRASLGRTGITGGTLAMIGQPLQLAALSNANRPLQDAQMSDSGQGMVNTEVTLPDNISAYIAGGYLNGDARPMPSVLDAGRDQLDGYYVAVGGEYLGEGSVVGLSFAYSDTDGDAFGGQHAGGKLYQGTLYSAFTLGSSGLTVSSQASAGLFATDTRRSFTVGTVDYNLHQHDQSLAASAEVNVGKDFGSLDGIVITPKVGARYSRLDFSKSKETGGDAALAFDRDSYDSLQGRAGIDLGGSLGAIKPHLTAAYVHEFNDSPTFFTADFVGGTGPGAPFALGSSDRNWAEVGGALRYDTGAVAFDVGVDTTFERKDIDYQTYRGSVTFRF